MHRKPPPRLPAADYVGLRQYFLTICTHIKLELFARPEIVEAATLQLRQSSERGKFAVIAYCFMPDHVHLLVEALTDRSDLQVFVRHYKQCTAFNAKQTHGVTLWQRGYYEHVMRSEESALQKARYILANPVRAGLVVRPYDIHGSEPSSRPSTTCCNEAKTLTLAHVVTGRPEGRPLHSLYRAVTV